jgi:cytochrome b involved in lipid metabolism
VPAPTAPADKTAAEGPGAGEAKAEPQPSKEYTLDDVAKHTGKDDCWVVVNGEV